MLCLPRYVNQDKLCKSSSLIDYSRLNLASALGDMEFRRYCDKAARSKTCWEDGSNGKTSPMEVGSDCDRPYCWPSCRGQRLIRRLRLVVCNSGDRAIGTYWQTAPSTAPLGSAEYYGQFDILVHKTREEAESVRKEKLETQELKAEPATVEEGSAESYS